jgi:hypothetical protein
MEGRVDGRIRREIEEIWNLLFLMTSNRILKEKVSISNGSLLKDKDL